MPTDTWPTPEAVQRRRDTFAVKFELVNDPMEPGEFQMLITHNGRQWFGLSLTPRERALVIAALLDYQPSE